MDFTPKEYKQLLAQLKVRREYWDQMYDDIDTYIYPLMADFNRERTPGENPSSRLYDNTAIHANQLLASGLHSMMTNPAIKWFTLRFSNSELNEIKALREWLDEVVLIMFDKINNPAAGFNTAMHELYLQYGAFNTASIFTGENSKRNGLSFSARSLSELYIGENDDGFIDTIFRDFKWTVRQMIQRWGEDGVSKQVRELWENNKGEREIRILHALHPRKKRTSDGGRKNMPVASVYIEIQTDHVLDDGGFEEMPQVTGRFYKSAGEVYGRGPGISALADVKMANQMKKTILKAAQKVVDPPIFLNAEGHIGPVNLFPNGVNWFEQGTDQPFSLQTKGKIPLGEQLLDRVSASIREIFFNDQLQLQQSPKMTATEVLQRIEEKLRLMGPMLGRLQTEILGPMIDRIFSICMRAGWFPPVPLDVQGEELKTEYTSPLAHAQRQMEAQGTLRMLDVMSFFIEGDPTILDNWDGDKAFISIGEIFNVPAKFFKDPEVVAQIRAQRAQQEQAQQLAELAKTGGAGLKSIAQAGATATGVAGG